MDPELEALLRRLRGPDPVAPADAAATFQPIDPRPSVRPAAPGMLRMISPAAADFVGRLHREVRVPEAQPNPFRAAANLLGAQDLAKMTPAAIADHPTQALGALALMAGGEGVGGAIGRLMRRVGPSTAGLRRRVADFIAPEAATERRMAQRAAEIDEMTGLANRRAFDRARAAAEADPNLRFAALDLIGLKAANDLVGAEKGDELIRNAGQAIRQAAREITGTERVFRTGGDEFVALVPADKADQVLARARELMPQEQIGRFQTGLRGAVGNTFEEADAGVRAAKAAETGPKYRTTEEPEKVVSAAWRTEDGQIFTGMTHGDAVDAMREAGLNARGEGGFVTSTGRFVSREEAAQLMGRRGSLLSEDL